MRKLTPRKDGQADAAPSWGVVVHLADAKGSTRAETGDVERLNPFTIYQVAKALGELGKLPDNGLHPNELAPICFVVKSYLRTWVERKDPMPLNFSLASLQELSKQVDALIERHFLSSGKFAMPEADAPVINDGSLWWLKQCLAKFETVLGEEMQQSATYYVPSRGIYSTSALIESADQSFPEEIAGFIPEKTKSDWKSAGRCLGFNLLTASGFHTARAVEGTLEAYYQTFAGKPGVTLHSWNDYIQQLEKIIIQKPTPAPSEKTIAELRQMKDDYRNPIAHPRVVLSEADARMLFNNGESLIIGMAQELAEAQVKGGVQLALAPVQAAP